MSDHGSATGEGAPTGDKRPKRGRSGISWQERLSKRRRAKSRSAQNQHQQPSSPARGDGDDDAKEGNVPAGTEREETDEMSTRDMRGILVCCQLNRRRECTRNMIDWFTETADELFPPKTGDGGEVATEDTARVEAGSDGMDRGKGNGAARSVADELERELAELKEEAEADRALGRHKARGFGGNSKRFCVQRNVTHAGSIFFVECTDPEVDVVRVCTVIMRGVLERGDLRCRYAVRLCPVETTSFSSVSALQTRAKALLARRMSELGERIKTFAIQWDRRASNALVSKADFIRTVASSMPHGYKVDLKHPDAHLLLQLLGRRTCLAVVSDYENLCKFNLQTAVTKHAANAASSSLLKVPSEGMTKI